MMMILRLFQGQFGLERNLILGLRRDCRYNRLTQCKIRHIYILFASVHPYLLVRHNSTILYDLHSRELNTIYHNVRRQQMEYPQHLQQQKPTNDKCHDHLPPLCAYLYGTPNSLRQQSHRKNRMYFDRDAAWSVNRTTFTTIAHSSCISRNINPFVYMFRLSTCVCTAQRAHGIHSPNDRMFIARDPVNCALCVVASASRMVEAPRVRE